MKAPKKSQSRLRALCQLSVGIFLDSCPLAPRVLQEPAPASRLRLWQRRLLPLARARVASVHLAASGDERLAFFPPPALEVLPGEDNDDPGLERPGDRGADEGANVCGQEASNDGDSEAALERAVDAWAGDLGALLRAGAELRGEYEGLLNQVGGPHSGGAMS